MKIYAIEMIEAARMPATWKNKWAGKMQQDIDLRSLHWKGLSASMVPNQMGVRLEIDGEDDGFFAPWPMIRGASYRVEEKQQGQKR